jgi:hypothetical protein
MACQYELYSERYFALNYQALLLYQSLKDNQLLHYETNNQVSTSQVLFWQTEDNCNAVILYNWSTQ